MAATKRKADSNGLPSRPVKQPSTESPSKRQKKDSKSKIDTKPNHDGNRQAPPKSILQKEEKSFPRGGASTLTPIEHRQIQIEATKDVLFEQSGSKRKPLDAESDDDLENVQPTSPVAAKKKKRRKDSSKKNDADIDLEEKRLRIEGLGMRRLVPGTIVLGRVAQVTSRDIALTLPNTLTGYVPLTEISDQINHRVEKLLEKANQNDDDEDEDKDKESDVDDFEHIDLKKLFRTGQFLRAYVTSSGAEGNATGKKRIELSLNPRLANHGLKKSDLVPYSMVQASVVSAEDHGLVMGLSLEDSTVKGFISSKELDDIKHSDVEEGTVFLCMILGSNTDGRIIKLSADHQKAGNVKKSNFLTSASSIMAFSPGTAAEILVSDVTDNGIRGKIMGMVDVTADIVHSGATKQKDMAKRYSIGSKTKARVIYCLPKDDGQAIGVSLLEPILQLQSNKALGPGLSDEQKLAMSEIVEEAKVVKVHPSLGLFLDLGPSQSLGFAHISRISDKKINNLSSDSGSYKLGSKHTARITGYNSTDDLYLVSLEQKVLDQPFLRVDDIPIGQVVKATVEKIVINDRGVGGILINLADGISGLVPEIHMADVHLQHPERKFREGMSVKARVLSTNPEKRQIRLTLKKSLVNSDVDPWLDYASIEVGAQSPGTLVNILPDGAVVRFYGSVRAFLPVYEMSEAFVEDARQHFKVGQVVNVRVTSIDPEKKKMTVSSKNPGEFGPEQLKAFEKLRPGNIVKGSITEIANNLVSLKLEHDINATLKLRHLTDGSEAKCKSLLKKLRVGQTLTDLVVLEKQEKRKAVTVSNKPDIIRSALSGEICAKFEDLKKGVQYVGFVRNITTLGAFVEFPGSVVALLTPLQMKDDMRIKPSFGLEIGETITTKVLSIDSTAQKASLTMKDHSTTEVSHRNDTKFEDLVNAVDGISKYHSDFSFGKKTKARIVSVKATQLNVQLADNVQGRIDVSELFEKWEDIKDRKKPLHNFKPKQTLDVKIIGIHDTKSRRFLPISHQTGKSVYELSAKHMSGNLSGVLTMDKLQVDDNVIGFVNNHGDGCLWVTLSPSVRGRVNFLELTQDLFILTDLDKNFPIGTALKLIVKSVDVASNKLDLTALGSKRQLTNIATLEDLTKGSILAGRVTKTTDRSVIVQLNESIIGVIPLTEISDNYDEANPLKYNKNEIIKVKVIDVDVANKKVTLSSRDSQILSSTLPVKDRQIMSLSQIKVNDIVRGFVKNVADQGLFISIGPTVTTFVRVSEISDAFIKDWRSTYSVDQIVTGKITHVDSSLNKVQMSLKASVIDVNYVPPLMFDDLKVKQVVSAKVRKVETYGVFIVVDNSNNVSGLCHRSEIADNKVEDVTKLYDEGDAVKAIVLKIDKAKRRVNFGLKASYFKDVDADSEEDMSVEEDDADTDGDGVNDESSDVEIGEDIDFSARQVIDMEGSDDEDSEEPESEEADVNGRKESNTNGLSGGGFDWSGGLMDEGQNADDSELENGNEKKKKKKKKPEIQIDKTGELDKFGPRAVADFERLLLGKPNDSAIWIQYMAFQLGLGEVDKARTIAERALKTINLRDQDEKLNVWVALLNLENSYGTDESVEEVFKRACEYQDKNEMHERLVSIFIESGHHSVSFPPPFFPLCKTFTIFTF
jgi:rRNA biogenesis protein RRP5